jgi:hypothetical protein
MQKHITILAALHIAYSGMILLGSHSLSSHSRRRAIVRRYRSDRDNNRCRYCCGNNHACTRSAGIDRRHRTPKKAFLGRDIDIDPGMFEPPEHSIWNSIRDIHDLGIGAVRDKDDTQ